jgi:esterase/lipase superfamily enzyme
MGEVERPSIWKLEFREDPEKHLVLLKTSLQEKDQFFADLAARIAGSPGKKTFVFIHGYNVTFADSARRTAQISYDLGFDGVPVFYSWPSQGTVRGYPVDEANVEWSQANLTAFLSDFLDRTDAESIYLIAHSMGNRALTRAFSFVAQKTPQARKRFRELILTAPDIDAAVFKRDILPQIRGGESSITLYASSSDKALLASKEFHGYLRAGEAGAGIIVMSGMDTIDATSVDTSFLGHSYFAENRSVLSDIYYLIRGPAPPGKRFGLSPVDTPSGRYWVFKK